VFYARRYAVAVQNRELFHKSLVEVLQTDPAVWPDQRLANEIAHRKARRYLKREKEWF
jgi:TRAP transporter T-component